MNLDFYGSNIKSFNRITNAVYTSGRKALYRLGCDLSVVVMPEAKQVKHLPYTLKELAQRW